MSDEQVAHSRQSVTGIGQEQAQTVGLEIIVRNELGLHARPAGQLAKEAQKFLARVWISCSDRKADAKSVLDILSLAVRSGQRVRLEAQGPDANTAVNSLSKLFADLFGEEK
jgi:phosphocarrier protein